MSAADTSPLHDYATPMYSHAVMTFRPIFDASSLPAVTGRARR